MADDESLSPRGDARFGTTRWSMVIRAGDVNSADAGAALEELCKSYWYPLYAFVRKTGKSEDEAKDLTQEFFCRLLDKQRLNAADPARGKFRSFLLSSIKNMMLDEWKKGQAQKRGGGMTVLSIDEEDPEGRYRLEPKDETTPESLFEKRWAQTLVNKTIARLQAECEEQGKPFEELKVYLLEPKGTVPFAETAAKLGTTETALKTSVHRLRRNYAAIFREEVAQTVDDPEEVDMEIQHLLTALGS